MVEQLTGYPGVFLICLLAGIGLPFPEDIAVSIVGVQVSSEAVSFWPALLLAALGVLCRDVIVWSIGRFLGDWAMRRPWLTRLVGGKRIDKARALVLKRGGCSVLAGRAMIGMRIPVFFVTGTMGIPLIQFIKWDALGLALTTPILVGLGMYLGAPLVDTLKSVLAQAGWIPWALGGLLLVVFVAKFAQSRRRNQTKDEEPINTSAL